MKEVIIVLEMQMREVRSRRAYLQSMLNTIPPNLQIQGTGRMILYQVNKLTSAISDLADACDNIKDCIDAE